MILPVPIISGNLEKLNICLSPPISYELLYPIAGALTNIFIFQVIEMFLMLTILLVKRLFVINSYNLCFEDLKIKQNLLK